MHFFGWSLASFHFVMCFLAVQGVDETLILSKTLIELSLMSAILSRVVVDQSTKEGTYHETTESKFSGGNSFQATIISRYNDETNEALLATTKYGHCVLAFRGAPLNWKHWNESINLTRYDVCKKNTLGKEICCSTRQGFYNSYFHTKYFTNMEQSIRDCARKCPKGLEECVVLTGHDHGGAMAILAAISLSDINPHVLTFGQPPTLESPCSLIPSKRIYRFINTQETDIVGIAYDPVSLIIGSNED
jgi:Lipase (class 3)